VFVRGFFRAGRRFDGGWAEVVEVVERAEALRRLMEVVEEDMSDWR